MTIDRIGLWKMKVVLAPLRLTTFLVSFGLLASGQVWAEIEFEWVTVGNPGNANDSFGFGQVNYSFRISKHGVTNAQYTEFLSAVADTDTNSLYDPRMESDAFGGIKQACAATCTYSVKTDRGDRPVNFVTFSDAMRFVNWLENGQPTGMQTASTTEVGVYTIGTGLNEVRATDATYFIPSENEWYKARYHKNDGVTGNYVPVLSVSPYGTVYRGRAHEWNEDLESAPDHTSGGEIVCCRVFFNGGPAGTGTAGSRSAGGTGLASRDIGFRVASALPTPVGDCNGDGELTPEDLACLTTTAERDSVLMALKTLPGDLDGDGEVAFADFLTLSVNFGQNLTAYTDGNVDLDNGVDFADFLILSANFGRGGNFTGSAVAVPEPQSALLLMLATSLLLRLWRHHV